MLSKHGLVSLLLLHAGLVVADGPVLEHDLSVDLDASTGAIAIRDHIVVHGTDSNAGSSHLPDLVVNPGYRVERLVVDGAPTDPAVRVADGRIDLPDGTGAVDITYRGTSVPHGWPYVVLTPAEQWYPDAPGYRHQFKLAARLPDGFSGLTQGDPIAAPANGLAWSMTRPQEGIYLVAGPWHRFEKDGGRAAAFLLEDDAGLADTYNSATLEWLTRYGRGIGAYPYHAFTLVENREQTGWGMPSFTLLGSRVIRLPFIINSSFPHEVLHNWWGNGVLVDLRRGNWSEGLTTYLADYLIRESRGEGRQYRLDTLSSWQDFDERGGDFPLSAFVGRHDRRTQAVGYGKGLFLFHMLRRRLGDAVFLSALRRLYREFVYRYADFDDVRRAFEAECGCALGAFFSQWLDRVGAPRLVLEHATPTDVDGRAAIRFTLRQHDAVPWQLAVPVRIVDVDGGVRDESVQLDEASRTYTLRLEAPAARIEVDAGFDLFRRLDPDERPMTFGRVFAAGHVVVVVADDTFRSVAEALLSRHPGWRIARAGDIATAGPEPVVLLGWPHPLASAWLAGGAGYRVDADGIEIGSVRYAVEEGRSVTLVDRGADGARGRTVMWLAAAAPDGVVDVMSRLTHYGRRSYVVFDDGDGSHAARSGQWSGRSTSLSKVFDDSMPAPVEPVAAPLL